MEKKERNLNKGIVLLKQILDRENSSADKLKTYQMFGCKRLEAISRLLNGKKKNAIIMAQPFDVFYVTLNKPENKENLMEVLEKDNKTIYVVVR